MTTVAPTLDWFFKQAWRWKCGLPEETYNSPARLPDLDVLRQTEFNHRFVSLMQNRLIMGAFRYGRFSPIKADYDLLGGIAKKLRDYGETGNTEALVDVANYALLEFSFPHHPEAHFRAMDDHEHCPRIASTTATGRTC